MKKIVVFDNNDDLCEIIKRILDEEGYSTIKVNNAGDLIEKINMLHDDLELLLLDSVMPINILSDTVRNHDHIKIIYMGESRYPDFDSNNIPVQNHVIDYIQKPFEKMELLDKIKQLVEN